MTLQEQTNKLVDWYIQAMLDQGITSEQVDRLREICQRHGHEIRRGVFIDLLMTTDGTDMEKFSRLFVELHCKVRKLEGVADQEIIGTLISNGAAGWTAALSSH